LDGTKEGECCSDFSRLNYNYFIYSSYRLGLVVLAVVGVLVGIGEKILELLRLVFLHLLF